MGGLDEIADSCPGSYAGSLPQKMLGGTPPLRHPNRQDVEEVSAITARQAHALKTSDVSALKVFYLILYYLVILQHAEQTVSPAYL